ncbi:MAG: serine/threonine protein kinase [Pirellulales bacterium]|nr:serine/threonine protein kinase [Pirellulales bacterium]
MESHPPEQYDFELLDSYLARLHAGERPEREEFLQQRPELASALRCIEALENLAPGQEENHAHAVTLDSGNLPGAKGSGVFPRDFGRYELLSEIGRGGMGVVYQARQKELDRTVALKMILASHLASPDQVKRFQSEARAAARLRHSNIVQIHEVGQLNGQDFFSMEYIEGESLAERIARGPIDQKAAVRIVAAVARAVEYLHQQGIVHRDLKPSNVLLDREDTPYLTDFGLAKAIFGGDDLTATGVIAGTPSYMAPEQAAGRRGQVGPATDVYSLGVILYELLTGRPPFRAETPVDTLLEVLSGDPPLPRRLNPKIPMALELICLKCLQKSPEERYPSAAALAEDLEHFLRGEPLAARPPGLAQKFWSWTRRQPALAVRLSGLGVFWIVAWINFGLHVIDGSFFVKISALLIAWMLVSLGCQILLVRGRWVFPARFLWGLSDTVLLLLVLLVGDGVMSPMVIGYPLLIVSAGLWFRVRFVWFMTGLSLISYGALVLDFYFRRPGLQTPRYSGFDRHAIFVLGLVILAAAVSYLVQRVRMLSSFYGQKLP